MTYGSILRPARPASPPQKAKKRVDVGVGGKTPKRYYSVATTVHHRSARTTWLSHLYEGRAAWLSLRDKTGRAQEFIGVIPKDQLLLNQGLTLPEAAILDATDDDVLDPVILYEGPEGLSMIKPQYMSVGDENDCYFIVWNFPGGRTPKIEMASRIKVVFPDGSAAIKVLKMPISVTTDQLYTRITSKAVIEAVKGDKKAALLLHSSEAMLGEVLAVFYRNYPLPRKINLIDPNTVPHDCYNYEQLVAESIRNRGSVAAGTKRRADEMSSSSTFLKVENSGVSVDSAAGADEPSFTECPAISRDSLTRTTAFFGKLISTAPNTHQQEEAADNKTTPPWYGIYHDL